MQKPAEALQEMYNRGRDILAVSRDHIGDVDILDDAAVSGWGASAFDLLQRVFPHDDMKVREFENVYHDPERHFDFMFKRLLALLENAITDLHSGYLFDLRQLLSAEVFDDLLEMAGHLIDESYHLPATSIAGAVLEDALRRLCAKEDVSLAGQSSIYTLNEALHKGQVYDKVQWSHIDAWRELRNAVDHHDFEKPSDINPIHVKSMISGINDFILKHLS